MKNIAKIMMLLSFVMTAACASGPEDKGVAEGRGSVVERQYAADGTDAQDDVDSADDRDSAEDKDTQDEKDVAADEKDSSDEKEYADDMDTAEDKESSDDKDADDDEGIEKTGNEFTIIAGDVLQITVWKEDGLDREILVLPDGTITFPLIGTIDVQGLTPRLAQKTIKKKLKKFIPDASVTVMVKAPLGHTVNVIGQVTKPGEIVIGRHMGVMEALSQVGGLTPYASTGHIIVLRYVDDKKTSIDFPYDDIVEGQHLEKDIDLKPGDVVVVPTAGLL